MKQVLIIEEAPLLREYLNFKLSENDIEVNLAKNGLEGSARMRNGAPDLVILDYSIGGNEYREVLKQKKMNPNTVNIPVILLARQIDQQKIFELLPFDVKKVYTKPLNPEPLFGTIAEILRVPFKNADTGPGVVEVHVNGGIIFIEISRGLNRDKLDLLYFKIREMAGLYKIRGPKIIIMISGTELTFSDTPNLQKLLETVIRSCGPEALYIRILTRDPFVRQFMEKQNDYANIPVVSSLPEIVKDLFDGADGDDEFRMAELLGDRVLISGGPGGEESFQMRFSAEAQVKRMNIETLRESLGGRNITVVDDDAMFRELVKNTFGKIGLSVREFSSGGDYLAAIEQERCDLLFLDLLMPKAGGFDVLKALAARGDSPPVIVISTVTQRDMMVRAFQLGIKSYLNKPVKPQEIFQKALEILEPNF